MNTPSPPICRFFPIRLPRWAATAIVLAAVGFLVGCSSWSSSAPGKSRGGLFSRDRASLRAKVEDDPFPSAAEVGLQTSDGLSR
jgi:hypothetical protein